MISCLKLRPEYSVDFTTTYEAQCMVNSTLHFTTLTIDIDRLTAL